MKKRSQVEPDIADLINKIQQQLFFLDKKMDTLIGKISDRPFERSQHSKPFQRSDQPQRHGEVKQVNSYLERILHKAICADCRKECEVPFKPTGDRPVYCKECFSKRRAGSSFRSNIDNKPTEVKPIQDSPSHKHQSGMAPKTPTRKPREKKKVSKGRKKRS